MNVVDERQGQQRTFNPMDSFYVDKPENSYNLEDVILLSCTPSSDVIVMLK